MIDMVSNPNYNSSLVMRADVIWDSEEDISAPAATATATPAGTKFEGEDTIPRYVSVKGYTLTRRLVRRFIPRNPLLDGYLCQSCLFYREEGQEGEEDKESEGTGGGGSIVIYLPHASTPISIPFYHPPVEGVAFLHHPSQSTSTAGDSPNYTISIHHLPFPPTSTSTPPTNPNRLPRILHHLLSTLATHGRGLLTGYNKRVHHDQLISRPTLQDTYLRLKAAHSHRLVTSWAESTDPRKHVFEDLLIAAFLIEWWGRLYYHSGQPPEKGKRPWVGFVDVGCGNGVLVDVLRREGWCGWGFDARRRKSWEVLMPTFSTTSTITTTTTTTSSSTSTGEPWLREMLLIPSLLPPSEIDGDNGRNDELRGVDIHNGIFPPHTFLISNHSDQLTGWTPLLAALSNCPFIAIPCCSYNLSGDKFRAPVPSHQTASGSAYAALCAWTENLAERVGWVVEKEVLRIPSTRNVAVLGRRRMAVDTNSAHGGQGDGIEDRVRTVLREEGGGVGWVGKCIGLVKGWGGKCH
ncbi:DUF1613-domain-containing protein [Terfezia boudieri ATCC MYA-4762]|uniref:tRNA (uracil-O(2)-)-methyltransferase n=1 Tax=Terfezia boudieri ATCC MYA-4762 TaxID=1051890 RepID=A0A3N4LXF2_9PEZI|nr:DUF1613-domain-containing protein [Terfezia boudieri ATCC MYA-4762]